MNSCKIIMAKERVVCPPKKLTIFAFERQLGGDMFFLPACSDPQYLHNHATNTCSWEEAKTQLPTIISPHDCKWKLPLHWTITERVSEHHYRSPSCSALPYTDKFFYFKLDVYGSCTAHLRSPPNKVAMCLMMLC